MPPSPWDDAEWMRVTPFVKKEYLINNRTAREVVRRLKIEQGFDTTLRKLKIKLIANGWWKKLTQPQYAAMSCMMQQYGRDISFSRPWCGGTTRKIIDGRKADKEWQRKRSTAEKQGKPPPKPLEFGAAQEILNEADFVILFPDKGHTRSRGSINTRSDDDNNNDSDDDDDSHSVASDEPMNEMITDSSRELNMHNFPVRPQPTQLDRGSRPMPVHGRRRMIEVLPYEAAWLADLHSNIFPQKSGYELAGPVISIVNHLDESFDTASNVAFEACDFTDFFNFHLNLTSFNPEVSVREKLIADTLAKYYRIHDPEGHKAEALEFSEYYVGQILAGHDTLDEYNHVDRQRARTKLCIMLEQANMELMTVCYWVSSVIMSYDKIKLLSGFFADCIDCIETSTSYLASILRPWIRFMVFSRQDLLQDWHFESQKLSRSTLEDMARTFDASRELKQSIDSLQQYGDSGSATWLILCLYHAWNVSREDATQGLRSLISCLQMAEAIFGKRHLITINCAYLVARGRERLGQLDLAVDQLRLTMFDLRPCSRMLKPTYHEVLLRLAQLLLAQNHTDDQEKLREARNLLEHVFAFRLQTMGAKANLTWQVAEELFTTIHKQGLGGEAERRRAELRNLHDAVWRDGH